MTLDLTLRLSEILLACALIQQSLEHISGVAQERYWAIWRIAAALLLISHYLNSVALAMLLLAGVVNIWRYHGPYNGGSDLMTLLLTTCLLLAQLAPSEQWRAVAMGYIGIQLILSYFQSGWVKLVNAEWRSGQALVDVFAFTAYPVSESLRKWSQQPQLLRLMARGVISFELLFPLCILHPISLWLGLAIAASFHFANAILFGLNRFFWIWLCAYPAAIWWQTRFAQFLAHF